jgi:hypothetical protein
VLAVVETHLAAVGDLPQAEVEALSQAAELPLEVELLRAVAERHPVVPGGRARIPFEIMDSEVRRSDLAAAD